MAQILITTLEWISAIRKEQGNLDAALETAERIRSHAELLVAMRPDDTSDAETLAFAWYRIASVLDMQHNLAAALRAFECDLAIAESLVAKEPHQGRLRDGLLKALEEIARVRTEMGDTDGAARANMRAKEVRNL